MQRRSQEKTANKNGTPRLMEVGPRDSSRSRSRSEAQNSRRNSGPWTSTWGRRNHREWERLKPKIKIEPKKRRVTELGEDVENKDIIHSGVKAQLQGARPRSDSEKNAVRARRGGCQPGLTPAQHEPERKQLKRRQLRTEDPEKIKRTNQTTLQLAREKGFRGLRNGL